MHAYPHTLIHAARTAELAAEAASWRRAHEAAAPTVPAVPALRNRLGAALISAGVRLLDPAHVQARPHTRVQQRAA
ncbi:hypothetical protein ACGFXC_11595 [Streptomyces sp. NPDC048507]|uniref:hypothetical protein n=1 Tax=Streptomyces sp. NPDC048507 TaxID=3365560 RepID=UPI00371FB533